MSFAKRILALIVVLAAAWLPCRAEGILDDCGRGLPPFLIDQLNALDTSNDYNVTSAYGVIIQLNDVVRRYGSAGMTECNNDIAFTKKIAEVANTEQSKIRQNASELLLNVVSRTTMCVVFDSLLDPQIKPVTRANLWRLVAIHNKVKGLDGNYFLLKKVIENQRPVLKSSGEDGAVAMRFLEDLDDALLWKRDTKTLTPIEVDRCKALPNVGRLFHRTE